MIRIELRHSYKDEKGGIWRNPVPVTSVTDHSWELYSGTGPLTRRNRFSNVGLSANSTIPDLIEDLGELEPITTVVTDQLLSEPAHVPEAQEPSPVPLRGAIPGVSFPHSVYDELVEQTIVELKKLGQLKGGEYAGDNDRLANFRRNAERLGLKMEQVWAVYANKHIDAINQYIHDLSTNTTRPRLEGLAGRADDVIVYMILFKAMLIEADVK